MDGVFISALYRRSKVRHVRSPGVGRAPLTDLIRALLGASVGSQTSNQFCAAY